MPIDAAQVDWGGAEAPAAPPNSPDPSQVKWEQPDPAVAPFAHQPGGAGMSHGGPSPHDSLASMLYPEVDFDTGLPFLDRTHLAQADNFAEKRAYLEKVYGKKNVEVDSDPYGQPMLVVSKDGKKIAADGGDGFHGFTASAVGSAPEWLSMGAGALSGAEAGAFLGPIGAGVGGLMGAAAGGMFGKTAVEGEKAVEGTYRKTPGQYADAVRGAGAAGLEGELGGQLTSKVISRILRGPLPNFLTQTDEQGRALTDRLLEGGARPYAETALPGLKKAQFSQARAAKTVGPARAQNEANEGYLERRVRDILKDSGVPEGHLGSVMKDISSDEARVPIEEVGEHVKTRVQAHKEMLEQNVTQQLSDLNTQIDRQLKHLDTLTQRHNPGDLGVDVGQGIRTARRDFGTAMSKVYEKVDALVGDQKLVSTDLPAKEATRLGKQLPRTGQLGLQRETAALGAQQVSQDDLRLYESLGLDPPPSGKVSFGDAQRFRTALRQKADELSLTRDSRAGAAARLADMWDYAIQAAGADPAAAPAVRLLNAADKAYSAGIKRFNDSTVKRLVKNLEAGLPPDPQEIARQIVQPGQEARVREIRKLVGEETWKRVAGQDWARIMAEATDETGQIDGARLLAEVRNRGKLMGVVYGDNVSRKIEELAKAVAARDGAIPAEALSPGKMQTTLQSLQQAQKSEESFLRENYLGLLGNPRRNPEQVYRWLVRPDNAAALRQSVQMFGENSPQIQGIRQAALKELLAQAKMAVADARSPDALGEALAKFTPEQQKLLFPGGMDENLKLLSREIRALMLDLSDESKASISAGQVLGKNLLLRVPIQIHDAMLQFVLSSPRVIRYLALGLKQPPGPARRAARDMLQNLVRYGTLSSSLNSNEGAQFDEQGDTTTLTGAAAGSGGAR